jgi:TonB family protein
MLIDQQPLRACSLLVVFGGALLGCMQGQPPAASSAPPSSSAATDTSPKAVTEPSAPTTLAATAPSSSPAKETPAPSASARGPDRSIDDIRAVIASNRDTFRGCFDESLKTHPGLEGKFMLHFMVNPDGTVKSAEADPTRSTIHAADMEACASRAVRALRFPPSRKGMESTIDYPFDFHPRASSKSRSTAP